MAQNKLPDPLPLSAVEAFDNALETIIMDKQNDYGNPLTSFRDISVMKSQIVNCTNPVVHHALEMILVKVARLAANPRHRDSAIDIAGYARIIAMEQSQDSF